MKTEDERRLDAALDDPGVAEDHQLAPLVKLGGDLRAAMNAAPPDSASQRRMFVHAVAARQTSAPALARIAVPALALSAALLFLALLSRTSAPGDILFPLRRSLYSVGLTQSPQEAVARHISQARTLITSADLAATEPARRLALRAVTELGAARKLLSELETSRRSAAVAEIDRLEDRAVNLLVNARGDLDGNEAEDSSGPGGGEDSSGPGGDEDSSGPGGGEDSSGPGGDEDSSGPGGGEDSSGPVGDEDSSGPGGGEDSSGPVGDEDSSGPGGGEDSSGSGGGEDSSGSGGGEDSSGSGGREDSSEGD